MGFQKASKKQAKLRMAITGPSGHGKTYTALTIATHLGGRIALIDTEHEAASKYADDATPTGQFSPVPGLFAFDSQALTDFHPQRYIDAIAEAAAGKYDVLIIDSLSHAWVGKGGALEIHDQVVAKQKTENKYTAWGPVTKIQTALIEAILSAPLHIIATMRSKTAYAQEGKQIKKVGMEPVQRDGVEYEFDVVGDMTLDDSKENFMVISKTRCSRLNGAVIPKPGKQLADTLKEWLGSGTPNGYVTPATNGVKQYAVAKDLLDDLQPKIAKLVGDGYLEAAKVVADLEAKAVELSYGAPKIWPPAIVNGWAVQFVKDFFARVKAQGNELLQRDDRDVLETKLQEAGKELSEILPGKTLESLTYAERNRIVRGLPKPVPQPSAN